MQQADAAHLFNVPLADTPRFLLFPFPNFGIENRSVLCYNGYKYKM